MHGAVEGAAAEQVHAATPQLAGAGAREHETAWWLLLLQGRVDHAEQLRHPLDLVYHHGGAGRTGQQFAQPLRASQQPAVQGGIEEVQIERIRLDVPQPSGLPGTARPEQETTMHGDLEESTY